MIEIWQISILIFVAAATVGLGIRIFTAGNRKTQKTNRQVNHSKKSVLQNIISEAREEIKSITRQYAHIAHVISIGAVDVNPAYLAFWIFTITDEERDRLQGDRVLEARLREAVEKAGYPKDAISEVGFAYESKQTVDERFGGDFWKAMK